METGTPAGICLTCGGSFPQLEGKRRRRKYCTDRCRRKWFKRRRPPLQPVRLAARCACCGRAFSFVDYPRSRRRFCSDRCGSTASYRAWRRRQGLPVHGDGAPRPMAAVCIRCRAHLTARRGKGRARRCCSTPCRRAHDFEVARLRRQVAALRADRDQARRALQRAPPGSAAALEERLAELGHLLDFCRARLSDRESPGAADTHDTETH